MNAQRANEISNAMDAGTSYVSTLKIGDTFNGTSPEARKRYRTRHEIMAFNYSAFQALQSKVLMLNGRNVITKIV